MDETHDEHPIDPATIDDLQQFLSTFKNKTTQPKMKKAILAKIEAHFSVLVRQDFVLLYDFKLRLLGSPQRRRGPRTFHVLLCSLSVVILENFPMYSVIDWVEQGHDGWDDDTPWECFFLMPPYGFPAYIAPNRSADIRLPASRWVVDSTSIHEYSELTKTKTSEDDSPSPPQSRKASRALNPLPGVGPPSSSGNHRSRKDDNEKRLSRGPTQFQSSTSLEAITHHMAVRSPVAQQTQSHQLGHRKQPIPSFSHFTGHIQSPSSNSKATPKPGVNCSYLAPLSKPLPRARGQQTKELFEMASRELCCYSSTPEGSSSSSERRRTSSMEEDEDEDLEGAIYSPSNESKGGSRKRKQKVDDDNAEADDNTFEAPKPKPSKKRKIRRARRKRDSPEVAAIYDSKGQRILVAPYLDSLPSALLQVSDPILEELEGELTCRDSLLRWKRRLPLRALCSPWHTLNAQRGKAKKDLIGSIVHRLIANTSEAHAIEEIFGGQVEMFERFKCVFFQPLPSVGAGTFNMAQLLAAAKELSLVEFSKGTSNEEPGAVDEDGDIVEDAA
ncbi:hypothetical protein BKA70DRAFT_1447124 [Coprinopsis sp. MPI-PUGE-AT-0042]|nr:hypothetical protein BKA70DRAFT_1447124 [Coprinopsis sp. MPI-PUGE-AT-0042]